MELPQDKNRYSIMPELRSFRRRLQAIPLLVKQTLFDRFNFCKRERLVVSTCRSVQDKKKEAHAGQGASNGIGIRQGSLQLAEYLF